MKAQIGVTEKHMSKESAVLCGFLADEFLLSLKTKNAHWNVEGADFYSNHHFFEEQYHQLDEFIDELAEYIRSLGHYAPATMKEFLQLTHLTEKRDQNNKSADFIKDLLADHESMIIHFRENINRFDDQLHDAGTSDFITDFMRRHTKMAWMLRAQLRKE